MKEIQNKHKIFIFYIFLISILVYLFMIITLAFVDLSYEESMKNPIYAFLNLVVAYLIILLIPILLIDFIYSRIIKRKISSKIDIKEDKSQIKETRKLDIYCIIFLMIFLFFLLSEESFTFLSNLLSLAILIVITPNLILTSFKLLFNKKREYKKVKQEHVKEQEIEDYYIEIFEPKERWIDIELEFITKILPYFFPESSEKVESWFNSPLTLKKIIGKDNMNFVRNSIRESRKKFHSYKIKIILYKYLFYEWTEEEYAIKTDYYVKKYINSFVDWWEKPIIRKWLEKKKTLIETFGKNLAGQIISSIRMYQIPLSRYVFNLSLNKLPKDARCLIAYDIINVFREKMAGFEDLEKWRGEQHKKLKIFNYIYIFSCFVILIIILYVIDLYSGRMLLLILGTFLLIGGISFYKFLITNMKHILNAISQFWASVFVFTLNITVFIYFFIFFYWHYFLYVLITFCWLIIIISYTIFKMQTRSISKTYEFHKKNYYFYLIALDLIMLLFLAFSIYFTINQQLISDSPLKDYDFIFYILIIFGFYLRAYSLQQDSSFSPDFWARMKKIRVLEVYNEIGILEDFAMILSNLSHQTVEEVIDNLELSKSIEYNYKKFGINFKINIDKTLQLISNYKNIIFNKIIPNCPENKTCSVLDNKLEQFDHKITERVIITEINLSSVGLRVYEKLPNNIRIALKRAERYFNIFRLCHEDSYGMSVLALTKSLEELFKILFNEFISYKDVMNCLHIISSDTRIQKELPIVSMIKNGVGRYTIGSFLYIIQETFSYPQKCQIRQELSRFLKKCLPVELSCIKKLRDITNYRNDYGHIAGEIITPEQYLNFREQIFQIINLLKVDLSDIKPISISTPKIDKTKII